jgi:hypothetical protein
MKTIKLLIPKILLGTLCLFCQLEITSSVVPVQLTILKAYASNPECVPSSTQECVKVVGSPPVEAPPSIDPGSGGGGGMGSGDAGNGTGGIGSPTPPVPPKFDNKACKEVSALNKERCINSVNAKYDNSANWCGILVLDPVIAGCTAWTSKGKEDELNFCAELNLVDNRLCDMNYP